MKMNGAGMLSSLIDVRIGDLETERAYWRLR
jgi:hypothetical protein